ncbi:plasmid-related transcriptional repressor protein [Limnobacter sp.]|uniref:plasmid-related transcriptional repressor protein n=1 Tax=Limnobacter sp. TaxID=2003368 RepID=UPI00374A4FB1
MSHQPHAIRNDFSQTLDLVRQWSQNAEENLEQEACSKQRELWIPGFSLGAFPNHLNRSSLFAPIAKGRRIFHRQATMVTRRDCVIEYTGEQLDEADGDLIMALIAFAQPFPIGTLVPIVRAEVLRKLERGTGKQQYDWLHRRIKALVEATMFLEAKKKDGTTRYSIGKTLSFRIIAEFSYCDQSETYRYKLDPRWVQMFGNREYSLIDFNKRMRIRRGKDMAKTIQRLVATSADPIQRYALDWLKDKMQYRSPMRKFREALTDACKELERLEIISTHKIEDSKKGRLQLAIWLQPSV